jgi:hypothetical protein
MSGAERKGALVATLLLGALTGGLLWYAFSPDWRTLYTGLDPDDARQTGQILTQAQIQFDLTADGTGIRVPFAQLDKARLATAAKGGVKSGRLGFEIFDKPNWVGSEFDEQVSGPLKASWSIRWARFQTWRRPGCTWSCLTIRCSARRSARPRLRWCSICATWRWPTVSRRRSGTWWLQPWMA